MARRPPYSATRRRWSAAPRPEAIRLEIVRRAAPGQLFADDLEPQAYLYLVDGDGRPAGHRHGPLELTAARHLAARQAGFHSLPVLEASA